MQWAIGTKSGVMPHQPFLPIFDAMENFRFNTLGLLSSTAGNAKWFSMNGEQNPSNVFSRFASLWTQKLPHLFSREKMSQSTPLM